MKQLDIETPDSLIFDLDGTLWNATGLYAKSWNQSLSTHNIDLRLSKEDIGSLTGLERSELLKRILPNHDPLFCDQVIEDVEVITRKLIPEVGGELYADVRESLISLSKHYRIFIVSNCDAGVIRLFMEWAKLTDFITDEMAHGINFKPKHHNIQLLIEKHRMKSPIYIGDTEGDSIQSKIAGIPFVFLSYGFGETKDFDLKFDSFKAFTTCFLNFKE